MGEIADRLDTMTVRASVPGAVSAELRGHDLHLAFAPGYYRSVSGPALEQTLARLCRVLWAARGKAYDTLMREVGGDPVPRERATGSLDRVYYQRLDALVATGSSADGRLRVEVRGQRDWTVRLDPGRLRESELIARAREAAAALIRDLLDKVRQAEQEVYNPLVRGTMGPV